MITVPEAGALLGRGRSAAYEDARSGALPTIVLGGRKVVPVGVFLVELLGFPAEGVCKWFAHPPKTQPDQDVLELHLTTHQTDSTPEVTD